jgi:hypothetical protein
MTPAPSPTRARRLPKLLVGAAVFLSVTGAYAGIVQRRDAAIDAARRLPDAERPTGRCSLWFVGSSTIARWQSLPRDMAPWDAHRRGVEGAELPQLTHWFGNDPAGPRPAAIVLYGGENDIANGSSVADTIAAYRRFVAAKRQRFGTLPVIALSLKPSPTRWANLPQQTEFNRWLARYAAGQRDLSFIDIRPLMLVDIRPGPFYQPDGIHMNAAGYAGWTKVIRARLRQILPAATIDACAGPEHR